MPNDFELIVKGCTSAEESCTESVVTPFTATAQAGLIKNPIKTVNERKDTMTRLAELRNAARLSQQELARRSGVKQGVISMIESGETKYPRLDTAAKLARALNCTVDELIGTDGDGLKETK